MQVGEKNQQPTDGVELCPADGIEALTALLMQAERLQQT